MKTNKTQEFAVRSLIIFTVAVNICAGGDDDDWPFNQPPFLPSTAQYPHDVWITIGKPTKLTLKRGWTFRDKFERFKDATLEFHCSNEGIIENITAVSLVQNGYIVFGEGWFDTTRLINGLSRGRVLITGSVEAMPASNTTAKLSDNVFVRVNVMSSLATDTVCEILKYVSLIASTYGMIIQLRLNRDLKSVIGLSADFVAFNLAAGFIPFFFTFGFFVFVIVEQRENTPMPESQITLLGSICSPTTFVVPFVLMVQYFKLERGSQKLSTGAICFIVAFLSTIFLALVCVVSIPTIKGMLIFYILAGAYSFFTVAKYIPQLHMNWILKAPAGLSRWYIVFDCFAGFITFIRICLYAHNYNDWKGAFTGFDNLVQTSLSIIFDVLLSGQVYYYHHYLPSSNEEISNLIQDEVVSDHLMPISFNGNEPRLTPNVSVRPRQTRNPTIRPRPRPTTNVPVRPYPTGNLAFRSRVNEIPSAPPLPGNSAAVAIIETVTTTTTTQSIAVIGNLGNTDNVAQNQDRERASPEANGICVICCECPVAVIATPCNHICLCQVCCDRLAAQDNRCPICRQPVDSNARVFLS